jgi:hypothetical protein
VTSVVGSCMSKVKLVISEVLMQSPRTHGHSKGPSQHDQEPELGDVAVSGLVHLKADASKGVVLETPSRTTRHARYLQMLVGDC